MVTIGHAAIASPGFAKPAPGQYMDDLLDEIEICHSVGTNIETVKLEEAAIVLSSIANFLTADWAEHNDRAENFQASLTICECLEKLQ